MFEQIKGLRHHSHIAITTVWLYIFILYRLNWEHCCEQCVMKQMEKPTGVDNKLKGSRYYPHTAVIISGRGDNSFFRLNGCSGSVVIDNS